MKNYGSLCFALLCVVLLFHFTSLSRICYRSFVAAYVARNFGYDALYIMRLHVRYSGKCTVM
ncbi:MAG: hypothetical protein LBR26_01040 [Prevotella sp.]|nr:hypothetical protein [Prevotella sp.]